jgi:hypothetical protein
MIHVPDADQQIGNASTTQDNGTRLGQMAL